MTSEAIKSRSIVAMIMAAGEGRRFGGCKPLAIVHGTTLLQRMVSQVRHLVSHTCVVTGAWHTSIVQAQRDGDLTDVTLIYNPAWQNGLGHSIAVGVSQLERDFDGILILLADQVAITASDIEALINQFEWNNIACGYYAGRRGVPAIFAKNSFQQLKSLTDDRGAKRLLYSSDVPVSEYNMPEASVDIDTQKDLEDWMRIAPAALYKSV